MVKEYLSQKGVPFVEYDVSRDRKAAQEMVNKTGQMGVPVTILDGQIVVGFNRARLDDILNRKPQPSLGISVADAGNITSRKGSTVAFGAYVGKVKANSLAERLGITPGDIVTSVNKEPISTAADIEKASAKLAKGSHINIVYLRDDKEHPTEGIV
jgi:glutaredoxin 3